ncbi:MAG: glyoxalase [Mycobacterium sp.]|nr:glyoxalase [Mycobacterium sp.]
MSPGVGSLRAMEQRISLITLGVDDLQRARTFYEQGLGWKPKAAPEGVVFYQLPGIAVALFGRNDLAEDAHHRIDGRFSGITIAINQRTEADVDAVLAEAEAAGATILKRAEKVFCLGGRAQPGVDHQSRWHTDDLTRAAAGATGRPLALRGSSGNRRSRCEQRPALQANLLFATSPRARRSVPLRRRTRVDRRGPDLVRENGIGCPH